MASVFNEKAPLVQSIDGALVRPITHSQHERSQIPLHRWVISITIACLIIVQSGRNLWRDTSEQLETHQPGTLNFDWSKATPSSKLKYTPCYKSSYCARLEVPLDWNSTDPNSKRATLAIIKRPAEVEVTHPSYGGAILFNPGGPGGSGVEFMNLYGESLAVILNVHMTTTEGEIFANKSRYYDLISWDPRAIGNTRPIIRGYPRAASKREFEQRWVDLAGSLEYPELFNRVYDIKGLDAALISSPQDGYTEDEHPARFSGTTSVVRDMVEIIEKHGEWREQAAKKAIKHLHQTGNTLSADEVAAMSEKTVYIPGQEKLQYWGFSYGTVIGQTFASMYPDRVGRLAMDGVVNATDYYAGAWSTELIDAEKINKNFTQECEAAGPRACSFSRLTRKTSESLLDGFERTLDSIRDIAITGVVEGEPVYMTGFWMSALLFSGWYSGFFGYRLGGEMLWNAAKRNTSFFSLPESETDDQDITPWQDRAAAQVLIVCIDAENKINETREEYYESVKRLQKQSPHFANSLTRITMPCHNFDLEPRWRFNGPFGAQTANPILVLSQTLDPITPLISAKKAAKLFPGSQVVEAQGIGHTSLGYPSVCTMRKIKEYFFTGQVPSNYTYCAASLRPFQGLEDIVKLTDDLPLSDRYLMAAGLKIASDFPPGNKEKCFAYAGEFKLPGKEAGDWWAVNGRNSGLFGSMDLRVKVQYV